VPEHRALRPVIESPDRSNHVANDDEECSRPIEVAEIQNRLFL
jgi:hypothetical protein